MDHGILNALHSSNRYNHPCTQHGSQCGLFCPICLCFLCDRCQDPHLTTGMILHSSQMQAFLASKGQQKQLEHIAELREEATKLFHIALDALSQRFGLAMAKIAIYEHDGAAEFIRQRISPEAMKVIEALRNGSQAEEEEAHELSWKKAALAESLKDVKDVINFSYSKAQQVSHSNGRSGSLSGYRALMGKAKTLCLAKGVSENSIPSTGSEISAGYINIGIPNKLNEPKKDIKSDFGKAKASLRMMSEYGFNRTNESKVVQIVGKVDMLEEKKAETPKAPKDVILSEEEWKKQYDQVCSKYKDADSVIKVSKEIIENKTNESSCTNK